EETMQPWATASVIAVTVLAFVFVVLRFVARWERKAKLGGDDWLIICSMALLVVVVGFIMGMVHYGMGLHADTLPTNNVVMVAKYLMIAEILYVINLVLTKISILYMYYRLFPLRAMKRWSWAIGGFCIAWVITIVFVFIFLCVPIQKMWYTTLPGHCVNQVGTWCANAASTILTDCAILVLPMPHVWRLQVDKTQRVLLVIMFALGFFVVFTSAYRFAVLLTYDAADSTWTLTWTVVWTAIEISAGIISACLPTLRPVVKLVWRTTKSTAGYSNDKSTTGGSKAGTVSALTASSTRPFQRLDDTQL
ncbi:hypothetical protein K490DRAFT_2949, partial [Saccharata proteae CBS 121410]